MCHLWVINVSSTNTHEVGGQTTVLTRACVRREPLALELCPSGDATQCEVTSVILHRVVHPELTGSVADGSPASAWNLQPSSSLHQVQSPTDTPHVFSPAGFEHACEALQGYLAHKRTPHPLEPYSRTIPRALRWSWEGGAVSYERGIPAQGSALQPWKRLASLLLHRRGKGCGQERMGLGIQPRVGWSE